MDFLTTAPHNVHMRYKPRHFLREWRDSRGMTLEQVAERVEEVGSKKNAADNADLVYPDSMTHVTLSRIENGKQPYKQQLLEILAEIYGADPASLIMRNPLDAGAPHSLLDSLSPEKRREAINFLEFLADRKAS